MVTKSKKEILCELYELENIFNVLADIRDNSRVISKSLERIADSLEKKK